MNRGGKGLNPHENSRQVSKAEGKHDNELAQAERDHKNELVQTEREHKEEIVQTEREYSKILIKASAALAEYTTKVKLISKFQKGASDYAEKMLQLKNEMSDLESKKNHIVKAIQPSISIISTLKNDIEKMLFLYKDRNNTFDILVGEIENLMFDYSAKIKSKELFSIVSDKKRELSNLCENIERLEREVLKKEQEKLSRQHEIQSQLDELTDINLKLSFLENKKSKEEIIGLFSMVGNSLTQDDDNANNSNFDEHNLKTGGQRRVVEADSIKIEGKS